MTSWSAANSHSVVFIHLWERQTLIRACFFFLVELFNRRGHSVTSWVKKVSSVSVAALLELFSSLFRTFVFRAFIWIYQTTWSVFCEVCLCNVSKREFNEAIGELDKSRCNIFERKRWQETAMWKEQWHSNNDSFWIGSAEHDTIPFIASKIFCAVPFYVCTHYWRKENLQFRKASCWPNEFEWNHWEIESDIY